MTFGRKKHRVRWLRRLWSLYFTVGAVVYPVLGFRSYAEFLVWVIWRAR